jgi:hypothetical protein
MDLIKLQSAGLALPVHRGGHTPQTPVGCLRREDGGKRSGQQGPRISRVEGSRAGASRLHMDEAPLYSRGKAGGHHLGPAQGAVDGAAGIPPVPQGGHHIGQTGRAVIGVIANR